MTVVERARAQFRVRVSGDPTGAPDWVRDIATVGEGPGWFEPDGVVWRVHGDLSTLVGGVAALLGQGAHPLALAGVQRHSAYLADPWKRLAGTARWLVVSTFGSAELAEREGGRVRAMHRVVRGTTDDGRAYSAGDPELLRWVHLAFTDAFLAAQQAAGRDLSGRFGRRWADAYVGDWSRAAEALGATDLPRTEAELAEAVAAYAPVLEPVPGRAAGVPRRTARAVAARARLLPGPGGRRGARAVAGARAAGRRARPRRRPDPAGGDARAAAGRCRSRSGRTARARRPRAGGSAPGPRPGWL